MSQKLKPRILVIDDDPNVGVYLSRLFDATGRFSVEVETEADAAMTAARLFRPDLLLVDIHMPSRSGLDIAIQLRAEPWLRFRPIIFFTGMVSREMPRALELGDGPTEYLAKGTPGNEIVATVDRLLRATGVLPALPSQ